MYYCLVIFIVFLISPLQVCEKLLSIKIHNISLKTVEKPLQSHSVK